MSRSSVGCKVVVKHTSNRKEHFYSKRSSLTYHHVSTTKSTGSLSASLSVARVTCFLRKANSDEFTVCIAVI